MRAVLLVSRGGPRIFVKGGGGYYLLQKVENRKNKKKRSLILNPILLPTLNRLCNIIIQRPWPLGPPPSGSAPVDVVPKNNSMSLEIADAVGVRKQDRTYEEYKLQRK